MVLALARPSEPWCFPAGSCFFSKLFYCQQYCQQLQATESRQKGVFSRISAFFEAVLLPVAAGNRISRSLEKRCFSRILFFEVVLLPAGNCFFSIFEVVLLPAVSKKVVFLGDFRRHVMEFLNVVLALARPSELLCFPAGSYFFSKLFYCLPATAFFRSRSTASSLETRCVSRLSDDTLGNFLTWFWHSLVLQSHGVFLPAATFFRGCSTACR